jgi:hypothetical protein
MISETFRSSTNFTAFPTSGGFCRSHVIASLIKRLPKIAKPTSVSTNALQYMFFYTHCLSCLQQNSNNVMKVSLHHLIDTTVSCFSIYMYSWKPSQITHQVMWTADGSLLPSNLKTVVTLSIT